MPARRLINLGRNSRRRQLDRTVAVDRRSSDRRSLRPTDAGLATSQQLEPIPVVAAAAVALWSRAPNDHEKFCRRSADPFRPPQAAVSLRIFGRVLLTLVSSLCDLCIWILSFGWEFQANRPISSFWGISYF